MKNPNVPSAFASSVQSQGGNYVPAGKYRMQIVGSSFKPTKSKTGMNLNLT